MKKLNRPHLWGLTLLQFIGLTQCSKDGDTVSNQPTPEPVTIVITASNLTASIDENPASGIALGTVQATVNTGSISFSIVSESISGAFSIDASSGVVSVADPAAFDFETQTSLTATIRLISGTASEEITVTINLNDVAENPQTFNLWQGPSITFSKENGADPSEEENQDRITSSVWITRGNAGGQIYNVVTENSASQATSPAGTEWAQGTFQDIENLSFTSFRKACPAEKPNNVVDVPMVVHLIEDDVYLEIIFSSWAVGKQGGFSYSRTTLE